MTGRRPRRLNVFPSWDVRLLVRRFSLVLVGRDDNDHRPPHTQQPLVPGNSIARASDPASSTRSLCSSGVHVSVRYDGVIYLSVVSVPWVFSFFFFFSSEITSGGKRNRNGCRHEGFRISLDRRNICREPKTFADGRTACIVYSSTRVCSVYKFVCPRPAATAGQSAC